MNSNNNANGGQQPTRRDWLRLKKTKRDPEQLGDATRQKSASPQRTVEPPSETYGQTIDSLPPVREALLNRNDINLLFDDLKNEAVDVSWLQGTKRHASANAATLDQARNTLLDGQVKKMQVRYQWNGEKWIDTIERQSNEQFRMIRIAHPM